MKKKLQKINPFYGFRGKPPQYVENNIKGNIILKKEESVTKKSFPKKIKLKK